MLLTKATFVHQNKEKKQTLICTIQRIRKETRRKQFFRIKEKIKKPEIIKSKEVKNVIMWKWTDPTDIVGQTVFNDFILTGYKESKTSTYILPSTGGYEITASFGAVLSIEQIPTTIGLRLLINDVAVGETETKMFGDGPLPTLQYSTLHFGQIGDKIQVQFKTDHPVQTIKLIPLTCRLEGINFTA